MFYLIPEGESVVEMANQITVTEFNTVIRVSLLRTFISNEF